MDKANIFCNASLIQVGAFGTSHINAVISSLKLKKILQEVEKICVKGDIFEDTLLHKVMLLNKVLQKIYLIGEERKYIGANLNFVDSPLGQIDPILEDNANVLPKEIIDPNLH